MAAETPAYRNPKLAVETRINDLLKRMTLKEKIMQLCTFSPVSQVRKVAEQYETAIEVSREHILQGFGQVGVFLRFTNPRQGAQLANAVQRIAVEETRLGIPLIVQDECLHGCMADGSTNFPQAIGLASMWSPELLEPVVDAIAKEVRARGINQCCSPTINIARDVRCGRTEETYGEDPHLTSRLAVAYIKHLQAHGIIATPKHFVANYVGDGGRDSHAIHFSERILREIYFPAFEASVKEAGALSMMTGHNSLDGIPCASNRWLLTDVLRKEWGFKGFVISDNGDVQKLISLHHQTDSLEEASAMALNAGMEADLIWPPPSPVNYGYAIHLEKAVKKGKVTAKTLDEAVRRVLRTKFQIGLFENPYVDEDAAERIIHCEEHRTLARETALLTPVLLKNEGLLPLKAKKIKTLAAIGPNAATARPGGYAPREIHLVSPLEGLQAKFGKSLKILHQQGCPLTAIDRKGIATAVKAAKRADAAILFVGNNSDKFMGVADTTEGERHDRSNLCLPGLQEELIHAVADVNKNTVVVLISGSAVIMESWLPKVKAVVHAWYPGEQGGHALADLLFGDANFTAKSPITMPKRTGQTPLYYNYRPNGRVPDYSDLRGTQEEFPFGHGLSYTDYSYEKLLVRKGRSPKTFPIRVSFSLTNTGKMAGEEIVQLYIHDLYSRITRPVKELKAFQRIALEPGETKKVSFLLEKKDFMYLDEKFKPILEPGDFEIMIGSSSADIRLSRTINL